MDIGPEARHVSSKRRPQKVLRKKIQHTINRWINAPRNMEKRTLSWTVEAHVELLHAIVHEGDLIVGHQPSKRQSRVSDNHSTHFPREPAQPAHIFMTSVSIRRLEEEWRPPSRACQHGKWGARSEKGTYHGSSRETNWRCRRGRSETNGSKAKRSEACARPVSQIRFRDCSQVWRHRPF